jgi:hypothetical protein
MTPPGTLEELDRGRAGGSLAREYERRKRTREVRARTAHPRIGGLLLALNGEPQHQRAFHQGDVGEKAVAASLEKHVSPPAVSLMNRRMPKGRGDIDFLVIAPSGVFVVDAKAVEGKVRIHNPWFGSTRLRINGRDRTKYIDGLERQVTAVRDALGGDEAEAVPIQSGLCFTEADLPRLKTLSMRGHLLLYRKALIDWINAPGPLTPEEIGRIARRLASALPPAS